MFSTYEDEKSVGLKVQYAKDNDLGGVMFWESSADRPIGQGSLIETAFNVIKNQD